MVIATQPAHRLVDGSDGDKLAPIPWEGQFGDGDFVPGTDLAVIANGLIERHSRFGILASAQIDFLWKAKGGVRAGKATWGQTVKLSGLAKHYSGEAFVVWIAADHARENGLTAWQLEALLFHELEHIAWDDEAQKYVLQGHDWEGFQSEIAEYGAWHSTLGRIARQFEQLTLPLPAATSAPAAEPAGVGA